MLNLWLGEGYPYGEVYKKIDMYFNLVKKKEWFSDPLIKEMIYNVDNGTVVLKDFALENPIVGGMSPDSLSGGVKTLILIKEFPKDVYHLNNCGENCFEWLFKICENEDRTAVLDYCPLISFLDPFEIKILNSGNIVHNAGELALECIDTVVRDVTPEEEEDEDRRAREIIQKMIENGEI